MAKTKHEAQVFRNSEGKFYWSCPTCEEASKPVQKYEEAEEGAEKHSADG